MKDLEGRIRKVEQAIRSVEDEQWRRTDPEKSARADDMVSKLEDAIAKIEADLAAAQAAGNEKQAKDLAENLESRQAFLEMARRAATDYLGLTPQFRRSTGRPERARGQDTVDMLSEPLDRVAGRRHASASTRRLSSWAASRAAARTPRAGRKYELWSTAAEASRTRRSSIGKPAAPSTSQQPAGRHDEVVVDRLEDQVGRAVAGHASERGASRRLVVGGDRAEGGRRGGAGVQLARGSRSSGSST